MIHESIHWLVQATGGYIHSGSGEVNFSGVSTDTRNLKKGELFFCLLGNQDGHQYAQKALDKGAAAVVMDRSHLSHLAKVSKKGVVVQVQDTLKALGDLAWAWRKKFSLPVLGLTGSNGKTTTKELIRTVLSPRYRVLATQGNFNNLIGVPLTLFQLDPEDEVAVVEMGMNDFGEITRLTEITEPDLALITNIGKAHLEKLGGLAGVAKCKGELFAGLSPKATALINLLDPQVKKLPTPARRKNYGTEESGIWGEILPQESSGDPLLKIKVHLGEEEGILALNLPGRHNLSNVLAAVAVGDYFDIPLTQAIAALEHFPGAPSRMEIIPLKSGKYLIDDSYNANPTSTKAALATLAELKQKKPGLAILGDMLELGEFNTQGHQEVGREVAVQKIDYLVAIGSYAHILLDAALENGMPPGKMLVFPDLDSAKSAIGNLWEKVDWILIKGSRGSHLETMVSYLKELD